MCCCVEGEMTPSLSASAAPAGSQGQINPPTSRRLGTAGLVLPVLTLILMPKCPVCVAAYVMFLTGISLSYSAASGIRLMMIVFSFAGLALLVVNAVRRLMTHRP